MENQEKIEIKTIITPRMKKSIQLKMSKDGTNYEIIAIECPNGYTNGYSCITEPAILIISGYDKTAYAFHKTHYISWDYVMEKLTPKGSDTDAKNLTILIIQAQKILNGEMTI